MNVTPLAFESLGVRSMCTLVRTKDVTVLLDAGVALGPRFRLMPHPREFRARDEARKRIEEAADRAKVVTISHYHHDHHTPNFLDPVWLGSSPESFERIYKGKIILAKDSRRKINTAQRRRGWMFRQAAEKLAEKFEAADEKSFEFGRTKLMFPAPVPHGEGKSELGWVLPCIVEKAREKMFFAPDVQGPVVEETVDLILKEKPDLLVMGGPPTYLQGYRISDEFFRTATRNMEKLLSSIPKVVIDHHLLRDEGWNKFLEPVRKSAQKAGHALLTASELLDQTPEPLECKRQSLYENEKPSKEFLEWAKLPDEKRTDTPPPLVS
ncbi:hypothetical protein AUF78_09440 [archaeon 13_1_20CM_2_51_12]|nr:MAG: hypothetical protein AUF78_09440 [archaeon 13_1_20CM_2_51_12]